MKWLFEIPTNIRPWWFVLITLLAALVLVQQAGAFQETWQNGGDSSWTDQTTTTYYYTDLFKGQHAGPNYYDVATPTNYWAFTTITGQYTPFFRLYDESKTLIYSFQFPWSVPYARYEFVRSGTSILVYKDGVYQSTTSGVTSVPYYCGWQNNGYEMGSALYFDDVVIGTSEEHNVISCPPQSWFVAKDIFDPGFSGLYSAVNTLANASYMHCSYATDDGSATVTVTGPGGVVDTRAVSSYAGIITYNLTTMLFNSGAPYGQYTVAISGSTASDTFWYKAIATSGTSVQWDDTAYSDGDEATITFSISEGNWDTYSYGYCLEIWDESLAQIESWAIPSRPVATNKTIDVNTANFGTSGMFYCVLTATDISSGEENLMVYDDAIVTLPGSGDVIVEGETYDATTNLTLTSCTVTATQLGVTHSTTSDAVTGAYEFTTGLVTDWSLGMNASKTGYIGYLQSFTPYVGGTYTVDIPLVPSGGPAPGGYSNATTSYYNSTTDGTAVGGLCYQGPYWTLGEGCNVTVSNSTFSTSCTTGAGGWYQCNNIGAGGSYTLSCSKSGYTPYTTSCSIEEGCFNREDCTLESSTDLNVECRELASGGLITDSTCTVSLSTGETCETTNGTAVFSGLAYGYYEISASAEGYYPGSTSAVMDSGKTVSCYLQAQGEEGSPGLSYAPHAVRFSFRDQNSNPLDNLSVTATPLECSGPWTWLAEWLGLNQTAVDIQGTTLSGTTGDDGSWTAWMIETVRYQMNAADASRGINTSWTLYPKENEYSYIIDLEPEVPEFAENIEWNVSAIDVNATHVYLHCAYSDLLDHTDSCTIEVLNSTGGVIYTQACSPANNCSVNYTVENIKGNAYTWGFTAEHTDFGTISNYKGITLEGTGGRLVDLGLEDFWYDMICLGALFMVALFFSSRMNPHGAITLALTGGILWFIGWLNVPYLIVACAIVIAILIYAEKKEERSPV